MEMNFFFFLFSFEQLLMCFVSLRVSIVQDKGAGFQILCLWAALIIVHSILTQDLKPSEQAGKTYSVPKKMPGLKNLGLWSVNSCLLHNKTMNIYTHESKIVVWSFLWSRHIESIDFFGSFMHERSESGKWQALITQCEANKSCECSVGISAIHFSCSAV